MTKTILPDYNKISSAFHSDNLAVTPSEIQGFLSGMLCGGLKMEQSTWTQLLYDYTNDGSPWPICSKEYAEICLNIAKTQLSSTEMNFELLMPPQESALIDKAQALSDWTNAFISGIGLMGLDSKKISTQTREIISDLAEIAQLGIDEEESMEEQLKFLIDIKEHVRICAMSLYLAMHFDNLENENNPSTLH